MLHAHKSLRIGVFFFLSTKRLGGDFGSSWRLSFFNLVKISVLGRGFGDSWRSNCSPRACGNMALHLSVVYLHGNMVALPSCKGRTLPKVRRCPSVWP